MNRVLLATGLIAALAGPAHAQRADQPVVVGLFAPTTPFAGPSERLQYVTSLAEHLAPAAGGRRVIGRVFARAGDLTAAVKKGEVSFALVDAPYAAARGNPWTPLAATTVRGAATGAWMIVAPPSVKGLAELRGKTVALPRTGASETSFLVNSLLEGEVDAGYFGGVTLAADAISAVTLVKLGQASAAFVPAAMALPAGLGKLVELRRIGWPMLVAMPGTDKGLIAAVTAQVRSFGGATLDGMTAADQGEYRGLAASMGKPSRRPLMALPGPPRFGVKGLLEGRVLVLPATDPAALLAEPSLD